MDNKEADSQEVLVDHFVVLLPNEYVKPRILKKSIHAPCHRGDNEDFCRDYTFPMIDRYTY